MCACYLSPNQYLLPGVIPPECDTTCNMVGSTGGGIPIYEYGGTSEGMIQKVCKQNTCVMDDVTISYINSHVGNTNFDQVCGCAGNGTCTCVMNNITISDINSIIQDGTNIDQYCSMCSQFSGSQGSPVECSTSEKEEFKKPTRNNKSTTVWWIIFLIIVLVVIFCILKK